MREEVKRRRRSQRSTRRTVFAVFARFWGQMLGLGCIARYDQLLCPLPLTVASLQLFSSFDAPLPRASLSLTCS